MALLARYYLIQPPEFAHRCDAGDPSAWCTLRLAIIMTYARYGLGYLAVATSLIALVWQGITSATVALSSGLLALVLYCYEPGAFAVMTGALLLARISLANADAVRPTH